MCLMISYHKLTVVKKMKIKRSEDSEHYYNADNIWGDIDKETSTILTCMCAES